MLECGIVYNDYEYQAGRKYIYAVTNTYGKRNEKRTLTDEGKAEIKRIAKETDYQTQKRLNEMGNVWHYLTKEHY